MDIIWQGTLKKMRVEDADPVRYFLSDGWFDPDARTGDHLLNDHLGGPLTLRFTGQIHCVACGRPTKKTFGQGFCFPCNRDRAEADICMVKPELCHHGDPEHPCREEAFAQAQCFQPHVLYVSLTSGLKVGITRRPNVPSRWIDQGAVTAVPVAILPDRRSVGLVERRLVDAGFADKTHWTRLLKGNPEDTDLSPVVDRVLTKLAEWDIAGVLPDDERRPRTFTYPVRVWPQKVRSHNLDKEPELTGTLQGIKGQYLLLDVAVINLRKYTGYKVEVLA